ncbi:protein of unknown function DUF81 [Caldithrix abyssi DSM 13497]|uniref:Probable membrane transporter protein n=1 Tax=Caldithrix abyssi DSM 13497 TaxID=880073 RepID=H1XV43_CALAY|nr:sulfite exporter TauE/SafE family protein [Caldithrix abyssi]APF18916.1 hypothetical protein Cabys_2167 [Caldithrix abyssi DSM 13497]EHO42876.1 protein of unknown function DUF81 [Caldithrix abyssi DSM 13497]
MTLLITVLIVGMLVGGISSVLGLGGGIILVPALNVVFRLPHSEAIATSLATIAFITLLNTVRFARRNEIDWTLVFYLLIFSAVSSGFGGFLVTFLSEQILLAIFILFLIYVLIQMFIGYQSRHSAPKQKSRWYWMSLIGVSSGLISGTTGVGGGIIITPLLFKSRLVKEGHVVPLTNAIMFLNAFFALIPLAFAQSAEHSFWGVGLIHFDRALLLFLGAIPASILGTKYQARIPVKLKKVFIALILLVILGRMILRWASSF